MKKIGLLIIVISGIYNLNIKSQITVVSKDHYDNSGNAEIITYNISSEPVIVINHDMIERFNSVCADGEYLSWSDLILGYDTQSLSDLYHAYVNYDSEKESLSDIKLALEQKKNENENLKIEHSEGFFAKAQKRNTENTNKASSVMIVQVVE